jgi:hypothetical protein
MIVSETPSSKIPYKMYQNGKRGYIVELYSQKLPKNAPYIFYGSQLACKEFIAER